MTGHRKRWLVQLLAFLSPIDLLAAFFDYPFQFVGFFVRECPCGAGKDCLAFLFADSLEAMD